MKNNLNKKNPFFHAKKDFFCKTQIFSLDFLVAVIAFAAILTASAVVWDYTAGKTDSTEKRNEIELAAMNVLSVLIETQGNPSNWSRLPVQNFNSSNVFSLGLAKNITHGLDFDGSWIIDREKLVYINSSAYNIAKNILGLAGYEFNLTLRTYNGTGFVSNYSVSGDLGNASNIARYTRYAMIDGKKAEISLKVAADE